MAVRIRLKRMGRTHRPFYRVCAMDSRAPRDGRVIEELGYYDPMIGETDARAILKSERIDYWLGVGAKPTDKVGVLIKKYGTDGTHLEQQKQALDRLQAKRTRVAPMATESVKPAKKEKKAKKEAEKTEEKAEAASEE